MTEITIYTVGESGYFASHEDTTWTATNTDQLGLMIQSIREAITDLTLIFEDWTPPSLDEDESKVIVIGGGYFVVVTPLGSSIQTVDGITEILALRIRAAIEGYVADTTYTFIIPTE